MSTIVRAPATREAPSETRRMRALVPLAAGAVAALSWIMIVPVSGFDLRAPAFQAGAPAPEIGLLQVVVTSVGASALGWGLLALLSRISSRPRAIWTAVAIVFTAVSLSGPFSGTGVGLANRLLVAGLHLVVAAVTIPLLRSTSPRNRAQGVR